VCLILLNSEKLYQHSTETSAGPAIQMLQGLAVAQKSDLV
jgi:hypothetical protein